MFMVKIIELIKMSVGLCALGCPKKMQLFSDAVFKLTNQAPVYYKYLGQIKTKSEMFGFYLAYILSGDRSQVGQFKS